MPYSEARKWEVYTLTDPRTLRARYVGVTHRSEATRYSQHLSQARRGRTHLHRWILSLLRIGEKPIYLALEYGQGEGWGERERFWITCHRKFCNLTNQTDGGEGSLGCAHTVETREKLRAARLGERASPETRAKLSAALKGKKKPPRSEEYRANISAVNLGKHLSLEHRAKLSAAGRARRHSPETRAKMSATHKDIWCRRKRKK